MGPDAPLASWRDTATRRQIVDFVDRVTTPGPDHVPEEARVAVFDNDGTLWVEKPMLVEMGFVLQRLARMAERDEALRERQPWKAAHENDTAWLGRLVTKHYQGDDTDLRVFMSGYFKAFDGMTVQQYLAAAEEFLGTARHPTLGRAFTELGYHPMGELLRYLEANGFTNYIASGGSRDFMRVVTSSMYGIPPERVVGSSNALSYRVDENGATVVYLADPGVFDDGEVKPTRIWSRIGRVPILAAGNSNGDVPMLRFAGGESLPGLRLLVRHDDGDREFAYTKGAEKALDEAADRGWTVVSMKDDWTTVFA
ncbi:MAG: haloacid dehalogenase-like hydrolase [Saccharothrix sp.]|nr:haloacid dehalogenase-like hydrolase [Saccharothrix sp.]